MRGLRRSLVTLLCVACCVCIWLAAFVCCLLLIPPAPAGRGPLEVPLHNVLSRDSAQATTCRRTPTLTVVDTFASQGLSTKLSTSSLREQPNLSRTLHLLLPPTLRTLVRWRTPQMLQAMRPDSTPENLQAVFCKQRHAGCDDSVRFSRRHLMRMGHQGSQQPNFGHGSGDCWKRSATVTQGDGSKVRTDRDDGDGL